MSSSSASLELLLIQPNERENIYQHLGSGLAALEPPLWAALAAAFVRKQGHSVRILDAQALGLSLEETVQAALAQKPRLIAVAIYGHQPSASTQSMPAAGNLAQSLKESQPEIPILFFGGHITALPQRTLEEESIDFVSSGEGLETLVDLLEALKTPFPDFKQIRDLWYRKGNEILKSETSAKLIENLDEELPAPAWDLLPMDRYRAHNWHCFGGLSRTPYAAIYTTLGCPYHCSFCCIQAPFRSGEKVSGYSSKTNSYRFWSPESVLSQIDSLVQSYGIKNIKIADEMFVLNPSHVKAICEGLIQRNYGLNLWAYARVDTVKDDMIQLLARAGFRWLAFGVEAADAQVRKDVSKGFEQEFIFRTLEKVRTAGISVIANYIFGLPEDTQETMKATLDLALELNTEFSNFYCTMAYPGSPLFEKAEAQNLLPGTWSGYSQHSADSLPLATRHLSAGAVLEFRDQAFQTYFQNPAYQKMISEKFGQETTEEIQKMIQRPLLRLHAHKN